MLQHTMIVSFSEPIPDSELSLFLKDVEQVMRDSGTIETFETRHHVRVPADDHPPTPVATTGTAIVQMGYADIGSLNTSYAAPGLRELIQRWQARFPYTVALVNHESFS
jgi:hypothetical protein